MRCASAMLNGLACWVLQCLPPFSAIRPPRLSANVILWPGSPLFPRLSPRLYPLPFSLTLGRTAARQYLGPGYPALRAALRRAAFALSQPEGKLIPRCSDGNVTWRARRQRGFPPTRRRRKGGKRRKSTDERRRAGQIVDDVTGGDDDDGKGVMEAGLRPTKLARHFYFRRDERRINYCRSEIVVAIYSS